MSSKEEPVTQLYQVESPEVERSGTRLRRNPRNPGSWCRPRLLPQAGPGCFGWLPPAYQTVTWWGKCCETALTVDAKNCEKKKGGGARMEDWKAN